jgi:hypothetical protein
MIGLIKQFDNYLFLEREAQFNTEREAQFNTKKEAQLKPVATCKQRREK